MNHLEHLEELIAGFAGHGERPAILAFQPDGIARWSYAQLADAIHGMARGLVAAGLKPGERVLLLANNRPEWIAAALAVIQAGGVLVPLDAQFSGEVLGRILADAEPHFGFTSSERVQTFEALEGQVAPQLFLLDVPEDDERSWHRLLREDGELPPVQADDPAMLFYTSGTTGPPKGVPLTHANLAFQINTLLDLTLIDPDERVLQPLPPHHVYPLNIGTLGPLAYGAPLVLPQALTGQQLLRAIREGEVALIVGVPRLYQALVDTIQQGLHDQRPPASYVGPRAIALSTWLAQRTGYSPGKALLRPLHQRFGSTLRLLISGGSAIDPALAQNLEGLGWRVAIGYGLTETSPLLTVHMPGDGRLDSVGKPIRGVELRIDPTAYPDDEQGEAPQSPNGPQPGEVQARGPGVFAGYHKLPEKTEKALSEDGWFRTGDLGYFDKSGYLHLSGRSSSLIVTPGGENIQPTTVEAAYAEHPAIREVGVLQEEGQLVALMVPNMQALREQGADDTEQAIRTIVDERADELPSYQRISDYLISREPLPRTRLGKLRRHVLAEQYAEAKQRAQDPQAEPERPMAIEDMADSDRQLLRNQAARQLWDWLAERNPDLLLNPDTNLQLDLGIDSLEWLNLTLAIERQAGVELNDEAITRIEIVRDLLQEVAEQAEAGHTVSEARLLEHPEEVLSAEQQHWLEPLPPRLRLQALALYTLNRGLILGAFRLAVRGRERVPAQAQLVFAPNHTSYLDPFVLSAALPYRQLRQTAWGGSARIAFANPLFRRASRLAQAVPIEHRQSLISSLAFGAAILRRDRSLIWFPEGHRSDDGALLDFRPGIGMLLAHYPVPVVPVFIHGAHQALPVGRAIPRPLRITVTFGEPLRPQDLEQQGEGDEAHERITGALRERSLALSREALSR